MKSRAKKKVSISISLGSKDQEKIEAIADAWDTSVSEAFRRLIQNFDLTSAN